MSNFNKEQGTIGFWAKNSLPQPVHHWKLNEESAGAVVDIGSSPVNGVNNGALVGQDGYRGRSYSFTRVDANNGDYIDIGRALTFEHTDSFSFVCWFLANDTTDYHCFISNVSNDDANYRGLEIFLGSAGTVMVLLRNSGGNRIQTVGTKDVIDSKWHHFVVTYDGSSQATGISIYIDTVKEVITTPQNTLSATILNPNDAYIGMRRGTTSIFPFDGYIQDARICDSELTEDEIKQLYQDARYIISADSIPAPIHRFPLDKPYVEDVGLIGSTPITINAPTFKTDNSKKYWEFLYASSQYVDCGDVANFERTDPFSVMAWFKTSASASGNGLTVVSRIEHPNGWWQGWNLVLWPDTVYSIDVAIMNNNTNKLEVYTGEFDINDGIWHNVCFTYDGSSNANGVLIYFDGIKATSVVIGVDNLTATVKNSSPLYIGFADEAWHWMDGDLSDVRIFNKVLTQEQIQSIMNDKESFELKIDERTSLIKSSVNENVENGLMSWNKLEGVSSEVGVDYTQTNSPVYVSGKFGNAVEVARYVGPVSNRNAIDIPANIFTTDYWTIEFWIKKVASIPDNGHAYNWIAGFGGNNDVALNVYNSSTGNRFGPYVSIWDITHSSYTIWKYTFGNNAELNAAFPVGEWKHVAITFDDSESTAADKMKFYLDGIKYSMSIYIGTGMNTYGGLCPGGSLAILYHSGTTEGVTWHMDNLKIWNHAKTDFSDRNEEYPTHILKPMQRYEIGDVREPEGLVLHSRLGSQYQVENSVVGPLGSIHDGSFDVAKFGDGFKSDVDGEYIDYDLSPPALAGTMEIWYKPVYDSTQNSIYEIIGYSIAADRWSLDYYNTASRFRLVFPISGGGTSVINYAAASFSAGDLIHLAMVWDSSGIDGSSDTVRLYYNGSDVASSTAALGVSTSKIRLGGNPPADYNANGVIDNIKVWSYAKTDFSDRFNEFPQGMVLEPDSVDLNKWMHLGMTWKQRDMITPADAEGLLLWNKLGSTSEAENSEVGVDGTIGGAVSYFDCKFGKGAEFNDATKYIDFISVGSLNTKGAVEMWVKSYISYSGTQTYYVFGSTDSSDGCLFYIGSDWVFYLNSTIVLHPGGSYGTYVGSPSYEANELQHFGICWDIDGIAGGADTARIYKNGILYAYGSITWATTFSVPGFRVGDCYTSGYPWPGLIDNFKVWDYAKTNFSDRFFEAPQEAVKRIYIDGDRKIEAVSPGLLSVPDRHAIIGSDTLKNNQANLMFDKIMISPRRLSDSEMSNLYLSEDIK